MGKIIEIKSTEEFETIISGEGVILVDFHADWCGPCRALGPVLEDVAEELEDLIIIKVNVDENPGLSGKYNVRSIPVVFALKNGEEVAKLVGLQSKDVYIKTVNDNSGEVEPKEDESEN